MSLAVAALRQRRSMMQESNDKTGTASSHRPRQQQVTARPPFESTCLSRCFTRGLHPPNCPPLPPPHKLPAQKHKALCSYMIPKSRERVEPAGLGCSFLLSLSNITVPSFMHGLFSSKSAPRTHLQPLPNCANRPDLFKTMQIVLRSSTEACAPTHSTVYQSTLPALGTAHATRPHILTYTHNTQTALLQTIQRKNTGGMPCWLETRTLAPSPLLTTLQTSLSRRSRRLGSVGTGQ